MSRTIRNEPTDYGRHLTELRRRARRPDVKGKKARNNQNRKAIRESMRHA